MEASASSSCLFSPMRAVVLESAYGIENLRVIEKPDPAPGPGEVVVDVEAATLNYRDLQPLHIRSGTSIPSRSRASSSWVRVSVARASREARTAGSAVRIGQAA